MLGRGMDYLPCVSDQSKQSSLSNSTTTSAGLKFMTMFYQLHDHQPINLDNLNTKLM